MKLGIGTYSYMWAIGFDGARPASPMTAMALLEKARELGVRVVQYGRLRSNLEPAVSTAITLPDKLR